MAVKKKFPFRAAVVACSEGCRALGADRAAAGQAADAADAADACPYGCIGCGKCVEACPFSAISLTPKGVARVDEEKCIACGKCAKACPRQLIHVHECANYIVVKCANREKGAVARKQCVASCIGCGICERTCTAGAIHVKENCAVIDETYCLSCGMCAVRCPRHAIHDLRGIYTPA